MSSLNRHKVHRNSFIIKGGIEVTKCFLGQLWTWKNYNFGYITQCNKWTSIIFIGNVENISKGEGGRREGQGEGDSRQKGGKEIGGISGPLNPPPSSPLPLNLWSTFPTNVIYTHWKDERKNQFYHFHTSKVAPKNIWRPKYLL